MLEDDLVLGGVLALGLVQAAQEDEAVDLGHHALLPDEELGLILGQVVEEVLRTAGRAELVS